jgi:hypothetical protein
MTTSHPIKYALELMAVWLDLPEQHYKPTVYLFAQKLPPAAVLEAVELARAKVPFGGEDGFRYFCGVCHNKIREQNAGTNNHEVIKFVVKTVPKHYKATVYSFAQKLPPDEVLRALEIAVLKFPYGGIECFKYFCGVCHSKIRQQEIKLSWN